MTWQTIDGHFSPQDQALNVHLAERIEEGTIVSVGVANGRAMAGLAEAIRQAGNLSAVTLVGVDYYYAGAFAEAAKNLVDVPKLRLVKTNTIDAADDYANGSLDAVFLDRGLDYETYAATIAAWRPKLIETGILCGHDYIPAHPGVIQAVDEAFPQGVTLFGTCWVPNAPAEPEPEPEPEPEA